MQTSMKDAVREAISEAIKHEFYSAYLFEEFCRLCTTARQQLADVAPLPPLGLPWKPLHQESHTLN
jgi:hypothetical protein